MASSPPTSCPDPVLAPVSREAGCCPPRPTPAHRIGSSRGCLPGERQAFSRWGPRAGQRVTGHPPAPSLWPQDGPSHSGKAGFLPDWEETVTYSRSSDPSLGGLGAGGSRGGSPLLCPGMGGPLSILGTPFLLPCQAAGPPAALGQTRGKAS